MLATASNGEVLCNINLSSKSLLVLLYSPIVSAIGNVMDFMVGTSEFVGIEYLFKEEKAGEMTYGNNKMEYCSKT